MTQPYMLPSSLRKCSLREQAQQQSSSQNVGDEHATTLTPVGVTIAFRQQQRRNLITESAMSRRSSRTTPSSSSSSSPQRLEQASASPTPSVTRPFLSRSSTSTLAVVEKQKKPVSSFQIFFEGASIYLACLILPSVVGSLYKQWLIHLDESSRFEAAAPIAVTTDSSYYYTVAQTYYDSYVKPYACSIDPTEYSPTLGLYYTYYLGCHSSPIKSVVSSGPAALFSIDATPLQDFEFVVMLSLCMALLRSMIMACTVVMNQNESFSSSVSETTVQAMIRCKSTSLLSSDYCCYESNISSVASEQHKSNHHSQSAVTSNQNTDDRDDSSHHVGLGIDDPSRDDEWRAAQVMPNAPLAVVVVVDDDDDDDGEISALSIPRFATALFRLGYSLTASTLAYVWFHRASFWPWYVGGSGTTSSCWDLSGGLALGMDSDFDSRNLVLKRYFLLQASYHSQSIAFHILSSVMLIWDYHQQMKRTDPVKLDCIQRGFWSVAQKTSRCYTRSLLQHLLALLLIAVAYIFSSLRRLGAIGMFAGDVSSCFMHLLQIALNKSSSSSSRTSDYWISWLYYGFVLPSFIFMRLCVWPRLWYSAAIESHSWFEQLEQTLFPNSSFVLKVTLHVWMILVTYLTGVGMKRLLHHPHLKRRLRQ